MRRQAPRKKNDKVRQAAKPEAEQPVAETKAKAVTEPPYTATDPLTGKPQKWMVWSYIAPGASRQRADKVGLVVHGAFVDEDTDDEHSKIRAFVAKLHDDWQDHDIYITEMGKWVPCPLPAHIDRLLPKTYDNKELDKIMKQHQKSEWDLKRANDARMRQLKKEQRDKVRFQQQQQIKLGEAAPEPRKPLDEESKQRVEELLTGPSPLDGLSVDCVSAEEAAAEAKQEDDQQ